MEQCSKQSNAAMSIKPVRQLKALARIQFRGSLISNKWIGFLPQPYFARLIPSEPLETSSAAQLCFCNSLLCNIKRVDDYVACYVAGLIDGFLTKCNQCNRTSITSNSWRRYMIVENHTSHHHITSITSQVITYHITLRWSTWFLVLGFWCDLSDRFQARRAP